MLKVLPQRISNLIAAGEVVQRPASAVKELVENGIDAGAENITVIIEDAGKTLIRIIDDGCGMSAEDAKLCFQRHATSKIASAEDLESVITYGFRGEALPSISAVAEVTLKTRKKGEPTGTETVFSPNGFVSQQETAMPQGTDISVSHIFYTIPARRKFLKSDNAEFRHIVAEFSKVALSRHNIGLRLIHNGKDVYNLKKANSLKQRILEIEGRDMVKELIDLETSNPILTIKGFVGNPEDARKSAGNQFFFVNGRYFRSSYLHKAVMKGYEHLIADGTYPSYYLYITIAPENVDVNIHPAKTEVKFENESEIFEILTAVVRESLGRHSSIPTIDFEHDLMPDWSASQQHFSTSFPSSDGCYESTRIQSGASAQYTGGGFGFGNTDGSPSKRHSSFNFQTDRQSVEGYTALFEDTAVQGPAIMRIGSRYIATPMRSGLLIVDIPRAKERIYYERYLRSLDDSSPISQEVLFPVQIDLSPEKHSILMEDPSRLSALGFDILSVGDNSVTVQGLPEGYSTCEEDVRGAIDSLIAMFMDETSQDFIKADKRDKMARKMALAAANCQLDRFSNEQARLLVDSLFACMEPETSPSGHRCMTMITEDELEKRL